MPQPMSTNLAVSTPVSLSWVRSQSTELVCSSSPAKASSYAGLIESKTSWAVSEISEAVSDAVEDIVGRCCGSGG